VIVISFFKKKNKDKSAEQDPPLPDNLPPPSSFYQQPVREPQQPVRQFQESSSNSQQPHNGNNPQAQQQSSQQNPQQNTNQNFKQTNLSPSLSSISSGSEAYNLSKNQQDTHSMIPNDIQLNTSETISNLSDQDLSPENLPDLDDDSGLSDCEPSLPDPGSFDQEIPKQVEDVELPPLPEISDGDAPNPDVPEISDTPSPESVDDIPSPPLIFSEKSFYDTPEEIRHMVEENIKNESNSRRSDYSNSMARLPDDDPVMAKPQLPNTTGPIFVDIESFKELLGDLENIKLRIKSSGEILRHLNDIKNSKDRELERWRESLEDMQRKINYVDHVVFKGA
jgi:hypothetical protein